MAKLEVLQCAACGSPLSPGALKCEYCGAQNLVKSKQNALKITSDVAKKYIAFYSEKTKENPKDTNALYSMGLLYLSLKNYELAQRNFKDAIDQSPLDPDVYYYYALALMGGKSIAKLSAKDVERVEQYLGTAMGMETKCKYLALLAVLKGGYYAANGLAVPGKPVAQFWNEAAEYTPEDLEELKDNLAINDSETAATLDKLTAGTYEQQTLETGTRLEVFDDLSGISEKSSKETIEKAKNLSSSDRYNYYRYWELPLEPSSMTGDVIKRVLWLLGALVVSSILMATCSGIITDKATVYTSVNSTVEARVAYKETDTKKLTAKEKRDLRAEVVKDSTEKAAEFAKSYANKSFKLYTSDNGKGKKTYTYLNLSFWGIFWLLVALFPLGWWAYKTREELLPDIRVRRRYNAYYRAYWSLPCTRFVEMEIYIANFLSKVTDIELKKHYKSEADFKGLTLFAVHPKVVNNRGVNYPVITYDIVTLEEDCVSLIQNTWDVLDDKVGENSRISQLSYSDISTVRVPDSYTLEFGDWTIRARKDSSNNEYLRSVKFEYQSELEDPIYKTYSTTRTSDLNKFAAALRKLVQDYKNRRQL